MDTHTFLLSLVSSAVGGSIVAAANHFLTRQRDRRERFEELRIGYLVEAWKQIQKASDIKDFSGLDKNALCDGLEEAVASVMLLGNLEETDAARNFAKQFSEGRGGSAFELLKVLRRNLRRELGITIDDTDLVALRLHRDKR